MGHSIRVISLCNSKWLFRHIEHMHDINNCQQNESYENLDNFLLYMAYVYASIGKCNAFIGQSTPTTAFDGVI